LRATSVLQDGRSQGPACVVLAAWWGRLNDDVRVPVEPIQTKELFHIKTNCYQGQLALHNPRPETLKDKRLLSPTPDARASWSGRADLELKVCSCCQ
ncbi:hypothetical protein KUCAC02_006407, partial [Chaenocephalus aceratus]